jgi:hypothetical protein
MDSVQSGLYFLRGISAISVVWREPFPGGSEAGKGRGLHSGGLGLRYVVLKEYAKMLGGPWPG